MQCIAMHCIRYTYVSTYIHTYIHTYMHAYMHTCIHAYMHTCIHAYMHTCIHAYMHTCIHAYIHTYIHTCRLKAAVHCFLEVITTPVPTFLPSASNQSKGKALRKYNIAGWEIPMLSSISCISLYFISCRFISF